MASTHPDYLNCSPDVIGGMIETATTALMEDFPKTTVNQEDLELILEALHVLRPDTVELETLDGLLHVVRGQWPEAVRVLHSVVERVPNFSYAKALLTFSLSSTGDPSWRNYADEVLASASSRSVKSLVLAVVARNDMLAAVRSSKLGGDFVTPESLTALQAMTDDQPDEPARASKSGSTAVQDALTAQQHAFIRV
ncbi:HrpB1 family type III secretion system apparatus protein [Paraburkholderia humisilvae]|uniref:Type III secretion protein HrpB1/HrpK n=1 Tax=Paraburkholderia humisilvae TaxID=627669 RepID=A0A6J5EGE5_9BURK|nr:HrpB1 family type III secretion system apparatus protein [Paraburkholderia humisilvae]CAB3764336.1 hypothetical protein LMG29542_04868 [Paraburkholderia humisilvae]